MDQRAEPKGGTVNQSSQVKEGRTRQMTDQANQFLEDGLTLEGAWTVFSGLKTLLADAKRRKYSQPCVEYCAETKIRAERRLGQIIVFMETDDPTASSFGPATAESLKIPNRQVAACKKLADISDEELERYCSIIRSADDQITTAEILREREEDSIRGMRELFHWMDVTGNEDLKLKAINDLRTLLGHPKRPLHEPMPKDF